MLTIEKLNDFGANTEEGLGRCYGNEALYLRLVGMIPAEASFDKLQSAIESNDLDAAFEAAHALNGVLGNLSLTPMYQVYKERYARRDVRRLIGESSCQQNCGQRQ